MGSEPSQELVDQLNAELERLGVLDDAELELTPQEVVTTVSDVYVQVNQLLADSGELASDPEEATTPALEDSDQAATTPEAEEPPIDSDPTTTSEEPVDPTTESATGTDADTTTSDA